MSKSTDEVRCCNCGLIHAIDKGYGSYSKECEQCGHEMQGFDINPPTGTHIGSSTATDWGAPMGTLIPQLTAGVIKQAPLFKTDHMDFSLKGKH